MYEVFILKSKDSESIKEEPIIYEYRFTVVTISYILLYGMINIMFLNMMVHSKHGDYMDTQHNI